jgi:hypothetical protein
MDMLEGVGRRSGNEKLLDLGQNTLNGYERNGLFRNNGDGTFTDVGWLNDADREEDGRGLAILDFDQDGRLDLALRNYRQPAVLLRNVGTDGNFASFKLQGTASNRDAVGARVRLRTGEAWQTRVVTLGSGYVSGSTLQQHFGLGKASTIDEVTIEWPSGQTSRFGPLDVNRTYRVIEQSNEEGDRPVISLILPPSSRDKEAAPTHLGEHGTGATREPHPES